MKLMRSLTLCMALLALSTALGAQILGEPLVYWDFADGIPAGFTNEGLGGAVWEYRGPDTTPDNTVCSQGACGVGSEPIESLSAANGFLIFDSAWWDDNVGGCSGGGGPVEAPHDAVLTTPAVDLSGAENLVFTWQQYFKHYQNSSTVSMSTDGGENWTLLHDNGGWYELGALDEWVSINITELVASDPTNVSFRFQFIGNHYWWCIDDIAIYSPNDNDMQLISAEYTNFDFNQEPDGYGDIPYHVYPANMLSPINLKGRAQNIGGLEQTNVGMQFVMTRDGEVVIDSTDVTPTAASGSVTNFSLAAYNLTGVGDYHISYDVYQDQVDDNPENNHAERDFQVHPHQYAQDKGVMESQYLGISLYENSAFEMGNLFQSRAAGYVIHSVGVALGDSTTVGTTITGKVYDRDEGDVLLGESAPYTVNAWDLNSVGDSKWVWLPLETPVVTYDTTLYWGVVAHEGGLERARIAQSGVPPIEVTLLEYPAENQVYYMPTTPMVRLGWFSAGDVPGCTDETADNYDAEANEDDSSCRYSGCTFADAINFSPDANFDDGSCLFAGCTDPEADNYDPEAAEDDGSCEYLGCTDPEAANYDPEANTDDSSCVYPGCTDPEADNYDAQANLDDGSCEYLGCTDPEADNYDASANVDDGSCEYFGCTNPNADNYDPDANVDDGTCIVSGCTDPEADNYDPEANNEDGTCIYLGCTDPEADNYDSNANQDDGMCEYWGCTDPNALNYDPEANTNDGTCEYNEAFFSVDQDSGCGSLTVTVNNQTIGTDAGSCSFNMGDGTVIESCDSPFEYTYSDLGEYIINYTFVVSDVVSDYSLTVNVYSEAITPEVAWDVDAGLLSCTNCAGDETFSWQAGEEEMSTEGTYSPEADGDYTLVVTNADGCVGTSTPFTVVFGCLDPFAVNYNAEANANAEDCAYPEATFEVTPTEGCPELEVTVTNTTILTGGSCLWDFGDEAIPVENCDGTVTYTYSGSGAFTITYTYTTGDWTSTATADIIVYPPAITPEIAYNTDTGELSCTNCAGDEVAAWTLDGDPAGGDALTWNPSEDGEYQLTITDANGCQGTSAALPVIVIGIAKFEAGLLMLYPNPVSDLLYVRTPAAQGALVLTDLRGRVVVPGRLATAQMQQFDVSNLAAGTYLLVWNKHGERSVNRLVVGH